MQSVLTRDLIGLATRSLDRPGAGGAPDPVLLPLPDTLPASRGRTVRWHPLVALAVAGHICRHWAQGEGADGPFEVEDGQSASGWIVLASPGDGRRLQAGGDPWAPSGIWITELCGHPACPQAAPAGPGTRCPDHFTDPDPYGAPGTHWADLATRAWGERYGGDGPEHPRRTDERRRWLVEAAVAAGLPEDEVATAIGTGPATVREILRPAPLPALDANYDEGV
ncbi:hypothetical protein [Kitasatospora sp. NPDC088783]|uniref:hypothetical protein n=1 Tax=Kitasatospora sp. NPDC088783 TaxID=3364077 RepID=UPI003814C15D